MLGKIKIPAIVLCIALAFCLYEYFGASSQKNPLQLQNDLPQIVKATEDPRFDDLAKKAPEPESVLKNNDQDDLVKKSLVEPTEIINKQQTVTVDHGQTLMSVLLKQKVSSNEAHSVLSSLKGVFNPKDLKAGQDIELCLEKNGSKETCLEKMSIRPDFGSEIKVEKQNDGTFVAQKKLSKIETTTTTARGVIQTSLFADASDQGVPQTIIAAVANGLSFEINLQHDIKSGDSFEVIFEVLKNVDTGETKTGELIYAGVLVKDEMHKMYNFTKPDGSRNLYNDEGTSLRRALLMTPIEGARLSSGFGNRKHPILGYTRKHEGIDFAAPPGTPIMSAGDGVVKTAGRKGAYGNYILIDHQNGYATAYAHLKAIRVRLKQKVSQGQIIGTVGSSGLATGPHLHHEVHLNGKKINPQKMKQPPKHKLAGSELALFKKFKDSLKSQIAGLPPKTNIPYKGIL